MESKTRNWLIAVLIVAFPFALFLGCLIFMETEPMPPLAPAPDPNSYGDLVKAGNLIQGNVSIYGQADLERLRTIVSSNSEAFSLARSALTNPCGVPVQLTRAFQTNRLQDLIAFRTLAQALVCEGKLAEKENRSGDAANSYLDTVRLGSQITHGGLLIDEMLGIAVLSLGELQLQGIVTNLDAATCRQSAATLEMLATNRQTWAETMQQEEAWSRRVFGWRRDWSKLTHYSERQGNLQHALDTIKADEQVEGRLMIALAARAYELDKDKPPVSAADLVPDYLKSIPQDPETGADMVLSPPIIP